MPHSRFRNALIIALLGLTVGTLAQAAVESMVIRIDSSTIQPIETGLIPPETGNLIVITEGSVKPFASSSRFTEGNFGPAGETRLARVGQPVMLGMPYGSVLGSFGPGTLPSFQFVGDCGVVTVGAGDVGDEFRLGLNMPDADLASMTGSLTVTLIYVSTGVEDVAEIDIDAASSELTPTGLIADTGDKFVALAIGNARVSFLTSGMTGGWFGPAGKLRFNRVGQQQSEGPYGGLYGTFSTAAAGFYLGDAGSWSTASVDVGDELSLFLNLSPADLASLQGTIKVWVIRIPNPTSAVGSDPSSDRLAAVGFPNPSAGQVDIRYALPSADDVLLRVYDATGRAVATLVDGPMASGEHQVRWDGRTSLGETVSSGTYFYQLTTTDGSKSGRLVVAR